MLGAAQRRAERLGITNVRFRQIDLSVPIDQEAASLDGVICRWGYMLLDDPESALRDTRRVLKQNATLALAAWTGPDDNLWGATPQRLLMRRGLIEPPQPGPGQFAWADPNVITETMETAGFVEPEIEAVDFAMHYASIDDWWVVQTKQSVAAGDRRRGARFRHPQRRAGRARGGRAARSCRPTTAS